MTKGKRADQDPGHWPGPHWGLVPQGEGKCGQIRADALPVGVRKEDYCRHGQHSRNFQDSGCLFIHDNRKQDNEHGTCVLKQGSANGNAPL